MTTRWVMPPWTGPDSPQTPVPVEACEVVTAKVIEPGIYDLPEHLYHADPVPGGSLSSTGARKLLPPNCPAVFAWQRDHPEPKGIFDFGSAAHKLILGSGPPILIVEADDWRTNAAKEMRAQARQEGEIPILRRDHDVLDRMVAAIVAHPVAAALFDPERGGNAEQSLFWENDGIWKRARLDWLPLIADRMVIGDYKTCVSADPAALAKAVVNFGYHQQTAWYLEAVQMLTGAYARFVFVAQEKTPPYLVTVFELDSEALRIGRERNQRACEIYRDCVDAGSWPGYAPDGEVRLIGLPRWAAYQHEESYA